ncbi:MAG: hypothetical protein LBD76_02455 [Prevotellaceae bacterium]|jgi:hypothetical protein|nr:hypothetical protein [Prevotellaceae bacterium]
MKKLLFNVVSVLILSICVSSCSKKDDVNPASKEDVAGIVWTISSVTEGINNPSGLDAEQQAQFTKFKNELKRVFQQGDKYSFAEDSSCSVSRGGVIADRPTSYAVSGGYLIFDGFIKFKTNLSGDKLTLTAADAEIREIAATELKNEIYGFDQDTIDTILKFLSGKLELILTQTKE